MALAGCLYSQRVPTRSSFSPCTPTSYPALQDFQVLQPAAPSVRVTVYLLLTTSDLIGHTSSKITFLSITVSLGSLLLNTGCSSSRLFKESLRSYLTDPGGERLHVYTPPLPKEQARTHKRFPWEDFAVLLHRQREHKRPSSITAKQLSQVCPVYCWQQRDPPASCEKHLAAH